MAETRYSTEGALAHVVGSEADPVEHDIALQRRRIISALAHHDGAYAMLSIPRRFAGSLLAQFKRAGYRYRTGWSPSEDLLAVTIWRPVGMEPELGMGMEDVGDE